MAKESPIAFRVDAEVKEALTKAAKEDRRSLSSLVEVILIDWLKEKGHLPK